ncbi:MAG: Toxin FitB [Chloroflexota bacterium]
MMRYLLDTNVVSELMKPTPSGSVRAWVDAQADETLAISAITVGELLRGVAKLPAGSRREQMRKIVETRLIPHFGDRLLPLDTACMTVWAALTVSCEQNSRTLPAVDSFIAATALTHRLTLVTRNTRDFVGTGVELVDPWNVGYG